MEIAFLMDFSPSLNLKPIFKKSCYPRAKARGNSCPPRQILLPNLELIGASPKWTFSIQSSNPSKPARSTPLWF
jgi:hypothetical protein